MIYISISNGTKAHIPTTQPDKLRGREYLAQKEQEAFDKSPIGIAIRLLTRMQLWVAAIVGAAIIKLIEWGITKFLGPPNKP